MDFLISYASEGENSYNSVDMKMSPKDSETTKRASDANYDPVQMDMSEESNNNNTSDDSNSERTSTPGALNAKNSEQTDSSKSRRSSSHQRERDHDSHSSNARGGSSGRGDRGKRPLERSHRSSNDERRRDHRDRGSRKSDSDRRSRDDDRKRGKSGSSGKDEDKERSEREHHRDERKDRDRGRNDRRRDRERRYSRRERSKDRHRDDRSNHHKEKDRPRSRSRSRERAPALSRPLTYREEKNRNKMAQLVKLGIELKAPEHDLNATNAQDEHNSYSPKTTATQGKYAEQIQKRKLLWANKTKREETNPSNSPNTWAGTMFTQDQDGKVSAKFKRLMGIKDDSNAPTATDTKPDIIKKQEEMFHNMEHQYEVARATTHTQRGVGLGYASGGFPFPR